MSETPTNVTPPPDLTYGYVDGRIILAIGDRSDAGRMPDPVPADGMTVTLTPATTILKVTSPTPATVIKQPIVCDVDANGYLVDGQGARGVWLVTGTYKVTYSHSRAIIPSHDIEVTTGHTEVAPLDLTTAMPPGGPVLAPSEYAELNGRLTILEAGVLPTRTITAGTGLTGGGDLSADRTLTVAYGTAAGTAAQGNDSRLSDARTPTAHTHPLADVTDAGTAAAADVGDFATAAQGTLADSATQPGDLATVATTGAYADLSGKPALGTAAATAATDYATAAQGVKADAALQPTTVTGLLAGNGTTTTGRTITGTADEITVTNGSGASGNPTLSLALTAAKVGALPIPDPGSFYPTDTIAAALQLIGSREMYGTGSPEGVVTAPVGTYYTITNGAMRWAKKTGTGNTGWKCIEGDTGWRAITSWTSGGVVTGQALTPSWAPTTGGPGSIRVRRINNEVLLGFRNLDRLAVTDISVWAAGYALPAGFRPSAYTQGVVFNSGGVAAIQWGSDGSVSRGTGPQAGVNGSYAGSGEVLVRAPALADIPWPTPLPGTAA